MKGYVEVPKVREIPRLRVEIVGIKENDNLKDSEEGKKMKDPHKTENSF